MGLGLKVMLGAALLLFFVSFVFYQGKSLNIFNSPDVNDKTLNSWMSSELVDIESGETYRLSDFKNKNILINSFSLDCESCVDEQDYIKDLHESIGSSVETITLDLYFDTDLDDLKEFRKLRGYHWIYSIAPESLTESLRSSFGSSILNLPSVPIILICEGGESVMLESYGPKDSGFIKKEISERC